MGDYQKEWYRKKKASQVARSKKYQDKKRLLIQGAKNVPCADCGVRYPPHVMDFDHVRGKKTYQIGGSPSVTDEKLLTEIAKCEVVCSNCHRERTHQRRSRT